MQAEKRVSDSYTEQIHILMPQHINGYKRLFGGVLMEWIDVLAAVVARRHANCNVTTASVDNLQFKAAAHVNSTIFMSGRITYVGRTSMEVRVDTCVESLDGNRKMVNRAYEHPVPVPRLILETEEERQEWEAGAKRHALRKQRRLENY